MADRRRRRGRTERQEAADAAARAADRDVLTRIRNPYKPLEVLSADQIEAIHEASLKILREIGIWFRHAPARAVLKAAGAEVDEATEMVRFDADLVGQAMARAPSRVRLHSRNPERMVEIGGNAVAFVAVGGAPNVSDLEHGRRAGTLAAFEDFMRLTQHFDVLHVLGFAPEPVDVAVPIRHLVATQSMLKLSDKVPFVFSRGDDAVRDALHMVRLAAGLSEEAFCDEACCYTVVNANSPLQFDVPMAQGIMDFATAGQLMVLTPFTLAGAMAPVTIAGALTQQNAEALAGITLAQCVRPGAPVAYGGFTSNVDMKSGAPAFGTPEYATAALAGGQLARRYGLPYRSSNVNAANAPDAQAAYESQMSIWGALLGGCHILKHAAGWLEGGLTASYEKFIIDVEMLQMMAYFLRPLTVDAATLAVEAVREVGPGGHFFGAGHTLERYATAFYQPYLSDWRNFETWQEAGKVDTTVRAHGLWQQALADYQAPDLDPGVAEELDDFVARRVAEGGADFG